MSNFISKKRVMVIEDDRDIRENLRELLEAEGHTVLLAENGKKALESLKHEDIHPNIILIDLMMPVMDGRAFIQATQDSPLLQNIPIVVVTAGDEKIEGRISGFMKKPLDLEEVLRVVEELGS